MLFALPFNIRNLKHVLRLTKLGTLTIIAWDCIKNTLLSRKLGLLLEYPLQPYVYFFARLFIIYFLIFLFLFVTRNICCFLSSRLFIIETK